MSEEARLWEVLAENPKHAPASGMLSITRGRKYSRSACSVCDLDMLTPGAVGTDWDQGGRPFVSSHAGLKDGAEPLRGQAVPLFVGSPVSPGHSLHRGYPLRRPYGTITPHRSSIALGLSLLTGVGVRPSLVHSQAGLYR